MAKMKAKKKKLLKGATAEDSHALTIPSPTFQLSGWFERLPKEKQKVVRTEGEGLARSMMSHVFSRIAIGEHLAHVQEVLEGEHGAFGAFLKNFNFTPKTAYRYIIGYKNSMLLPEPIRKEAIVRGMDIMGYTEDKPLGMYTEAVAVLPPPKHPTEIEAKTYLAKLEDMRKKVKKEGLPETVAEEVIDENQMIKAMLHFCSTQLDKLPSGNSQSAVKRKMKVIRTFVGMLLANAGLQSSQTFEPTAVPETMKVYRGRPSEERLQLLAQAQ
jgi:hypothetical protein